MNLLQKLFELSNIIFEMKKNISAVIDLIPDVESYLISNFTYLKNQIKNIFLKIYETLKSVIDNFNDLVRYLSSIDITERTEDFYNKDLSVFLPDAFKISNSIRVNQFWNYCKDKIIKEKPEVASEANKLFAYSEINYFFFAIPEWTFPISVTVFLDEYETFTVPL